LRTATHALTRRDGALDGPASTDVSQFAEVCAQNTVLAILQHLDELRGASRFTAWVYFVRDQVILISMNRRLLRDAPADPHRVALQRETLAVIRDRSSPQQSAAAGAEGHRLRRGAARRGRAARRVERAASTAERSMTTVPLMAHGSVRRNPRGSAARARVQ